MPTSVAFVCTSYVTICCNPSVIDSLEALKVDSLQKLCSSLEPILRRVVSEEVEHALAKLGPTCPATIQGRSSPNELKAMMVETSSFSLGLGYPFHFLLEGKYKASREQNSCCAA